MSLAIVEVPRVRSCPVCQSPGFRRGSPDSSGRPVVVCQNSECFVIRFDSPGAYPAQRAHIERARRLHLSGPPRELRRPFMANMWWHAQACPTCAEDLERAFLLTFSVLGCAAATGVAEDYAGAPL